MKSLAELQHLLDTSSDDKNPSPECLARLMGEAHHIAVVGLSRNLEKPARRVTSYLAAKGYDVIPVNPNAERLLGRVSFPSLESVKGTIDLVLIFRPDADAGSLIEQAVHHPEKPAIWLQTGIRSVPEVDAARAEGRTVVQDLCIFRVHRALMD